MSKIMENEEIEVKQLVFDLFQWQNIFSKSECSRKIKREDRPQRKIIDGDRE